MFPESYERWISLHGIVKQSEETLGCRQDHRCVLQFANKGLQLLDGNRLPTEDILGFFYVRFCFLGRELDRPFDAVKLKTNHILCCAEVPIALLQFLFGDRVLPLRVYRDCRRREDGLNAMDGCSSEGGDVGSILQLGSSIAEVVDIDLQTFGGHFGLAPDGYILDRHQLLNVIH